MQLRQAQSKSSWRPGALWCAGLGTLLGSGGTPAPPVAFGGLEVEMVGGGPQTQPGGRVVVLLHGWGAPGDDLVPLAHLLARPRTRVVVPAAPLPHPFGGRAWWNLDLERLQRRDRTLTSEVPEGLLAARAQVQALLVDLRRRYRPEVLILAGFSQGAMLAMDVALAAEPAVDRVALMSGALIAEPVWRAHMAGPSRPTVFMSHGRQDGVLPFLASELLKRLLDEHGFSVTWLPFDGGHEIPPPVVAGLCDFIGR